LILACRCMSACLSRSISPMSSDTCFFCLSRYARCLRSGQLTTLFARILKDGACTHDDLFCSFLRLVCVEDTV
jgi:hypothetical protein